MKTIAINMIIINRTITNGIVFKRVRSERMVTNRTEIS
jgi:hypothetical protein